VYNTQMINIEDFEKIEIKIGRVVSVEKVVGADKLLKFVFDLGTEERQILSGIAEFYPDLNALIGKEIPILINLEPRIIRGQKSEGMVLVAIAEEGRPVLLHPASDVPPGSQVR
jgi:methionine--tRNA ligase beta chain